MVIINEFGIDLLSIIFEYLSRQTIVYALTSNKNMYNIYKRKTPHYTLCTFICEKDIYDKHPYFLSKEAMTKIKHHLKMHIPKNLTTIYSVLHWYSIYIKLLNFYNIFVYNSRSIIFISSTNLDILKIFSSITNLSTSDPRFHECFNTCEKIKDMHLKRKMASYMNVNSYQYHQINYENYTDFVNELYLKLKCIKSY